MTATPGNDPADKQLNDNLLEAMVEATMQNHDLGPWTQVERELFEATCQRCGMHVQVSAVTIRSTLAVRCPTQGTLPRIISNLRAAAHTGDVPRFKQAFHTLLAHFSTYTYRQIAADEGFASRAWDELPEEQQRHVSNLRQILDEKKQVGKQVDEQADEQAGEDETEAD